MTEVAERPFQRWIGRKSEAEDVVSERLVASFRAMFEPNLAPVGDGEAPLGIHWCLAPAIAPMAELGPDGHPAKNTDMPPVPQPRRMWAGGSVETFDALRIGEKVRRVTTIADVARKQGRSGELWFVAVSRDYVTARGTAIRERHDIVYREVATPGTAREAARPAREAGPARHFAQSWELDPTPTLLFRYSAITFNGHRIHYDLRYATEVEGYAGLVVHGPLQATLLFNLAAAEGGGAPGRFDYRGLAPAFAADRLLVCAGGAGHEGTVWTQGPAGQIHMEGKAMAS